MRAEDADSVAALHAASWRDSYRGILSDAYLDHQLLADRRRLWRERLLDKPQSGQIGLLAFMDDGLAGFAYALPGSHARWGTLLENLHVNPGRRGGGIGTALLHAAAGRVMANQGATGLFLWVFERNVRAQALYERLGAVRIERAEEEAPDGGMAATWMYAWSDVGVLHRASAEGRR